MHSHSSAKNKLKSNLIIVGLLAFTALLGWLYYQFTGNIFGVYYSVLFGVIYALISYFTASKVALKLNRAKEISKKDYPKIFKIVEDLTKKAGLPMPKIYIVNDPAAK
jgi:heat shock protein HtpX